MKVSITNPFSTATPDSAMKPTAAEIENGMSRSQSTSTPPVIASGTPLNTSKASRTLPNVANSSAKISSSANGTTTCSRWRADSNCSNWPPHAVQ